MKKEKTLFPHVLTYWVFPMLIAVIVPCIAGLIAFLVYGDALPLTENCIIIPINIALGVIVVIYCIFFIGMLSLPPNNMDSDIRKIFFFGLGLLIVMAVAGMLWNEPPILSATIIMVTGWEIIKSLIALFRKGHKEFGVRSIVVFATTLLLSFVCINTLKQNELHKIQSHQNDYHQASYFIQATEDPINENNAKFSLKNNNGDTVIERGTIVVCQRIPAKFLFKRKYLLVHKNATKDDIMKAGKLKRTLTWENIIVP